MLKLCTRQLAAVILLLQVLLVVPARAQFGPGTQWTKDGNGYMAAENGEIVQLDARDKARRTVLVSKAQLTPQGQTVPIEVRRFAFSDDGRKVLLHTNTKKVWRYDTRGDYWVADLKANTMKQLGKGRPESSLMFAKF
ncbi:MAG: DPP IV N-terminal domain-containing protein, partial [Hymenobacter sp.]|nr:DPP IV N-terminal domain-containing protein [Hymenobacter sp.]